MPGSHQVRFCDHKLVEVITVADVSDEDRVGNSLLQIWKLRFGRKAKFYSDLELG